MNTTASKGDNSILFLAMYPLREINRGPIVRIVNLKAALEKRANIFTIAGNRMERRIKIGKFVISSLLKKVNGVYVESNSITSSEIEWFFLFFLRYIRKIPIIIYIRDAYFYFKETYYPLSWKKRLFKVLWKTSIWVYKHTATSLAFPSQGLVDLFQVKNSFILPPGSKFLSNVPPPQKTNVFLYVGGLTPEVYGVKTLLDAFILLNDTKEIRYNLLIVCRQDELHYICEYIHYPFLQISHYDYQGIVDIIKDIMATIVIYEKSAYSHMAIPVKLMDYLAFGRPIIAVDAYEVSKIVKETKTGIVIENSVEGLIKGIKYVANLTEEDLIQYTLNTKETVKKYSWDNCAAKILATLQTN